MCILQTINPWQRKSLLEIQKSSHLCSFLHLSVSVYLYPSFLTSFGRSRTLLFLSLQNACEGEETLLKIQRKTPSLNRTLCHWWEHNSTSTALSSCEKRNWKLDSCYLSFWSFIALSERSGDTGLRSHRMWNHSAAEVWKKAISHTLWKCLISASWLVCSQRRL